MSLLPKKLKLQAWRGATFRVTMTLYEEDENGPVLNLTDYTGKLEVRDKKGGTVLLTLVEGDGISFGGEDGTLILYLSEEDVTALEWVQGIYDLTITAPEGGDTDALFWGNFIIEGIE